MYEFPVPTAIMHYAHTFALSHLSCTSVSDNTSRVPCPVQSRRQAVAEVRSKTSLAPSAALHTPHTDDDGLGSTLGGYWELRQRLNQLFADWWLRSDVYRRLNVRALKGVLLHGPTGCGKTALVQSLAAASKLNFVEVQAAEVFSPYLGDSEESVRYDFAFCMCYRGTSSC